MNDGNTNDAEKTIKFSHIPGLILDELTEYAIAKEGIELKDLEPK